MSANELIQLLSLPAQKRMAIALLGISALAIFVMAHHPVSHGHSAAEKAQSIQAIAPLAKAVHGTLIAAICAQALLLQAFAHCLLPSSLAARFAGQVIWIAVVLFCLAALINGFAVPNTMIASTDAEVSLEALRFAWYFNQALSVAGSCFWILGTALYALALKPLSHRGIWLTAAIWLGFALCFTIVPALLLGVLKLNVTGMLLVVVLISSWQILVAWGWLRRAR